MDLDLMVHDHPSARILIQNKENLANDEKEVHNSFAKLGIPMINIGLEKLTSDFSDILAKYVSKGIATWTLPKSLVNESQLNHQLKMIDSNVSRMKVSNLLLVDHYGISWENLEKQSKKLKAPKRMQSTVILLMPPR